MLGDDWLTAAARVVLPAGVAVIMFCLGLELRPADFARTLRRPRLLAAAVVCQVALLPLVAVGVAGSLSLSVPLTAGLVLVACCPVSAPANLLARLARADVAASLANTVLTLPAAAVSIPLALRLTGYWDAERPLSHASLWHVSLTLAALVLVPTTAGILLRAFAPKKVRRIEAVAVRVALAAFLVGLTLAVLACLKDIPASFRTAGLAAALVNAVGLAGTYAFARLVRVDPPQRIVLTLGSTTRQFSVAAFVALTLCQDARLLPPAIAYCVLMWVVPAAGMWRARK